MKDIELVDFYGYPLKVNRYVLTPSIETEQLISKTIKHLADFSNPKIADIGTGSGCIGIALKKEIECDVTLVDISHKALEVAEKNALDNEADVELLLGSFLSPLKGKYDCIISNPMYLSYGDDVAEIVARSEPVIAHYSGTDGLACYDAILKDARLHLKKKFLIAFQLGQTPIIPLKKKIKQYFPNAQVWIEQDMNKKDMYIFIKEG